MQMDFLDQTLQNEMRNLRKWMGRIEKRMLFLEEIQNLRNQVKVQREAANKVIEQLKFFGT